MVVVVVRLWSHVLLGDSEEMNGYGPSPPRLDVTTASTSDPLLVSWLTIKVRGLLCSARIRPSVPP